MKSEKSKKSDGFFNLPEKCKKCSYCFFATSNGYDLVYACRRNGGCKIKERGERNEPGKNKKTAKTIP
jgi:hypothetical protein